ncbi:hypothetical protein M413DRAFT_227588 [Hebeloma cylindrosporum]|uniref:Mitochondrial cytochrome c oxidase subunit VIa n=1 Tax=Hebeloma cylindrosporum TaxID=76867 RepID=A0A0C2Z524_HEBCY|nr:hypothetical protein M413DRAFT_227588 [Hebeloma cylindrosporum h7]
MSFALRNSVRAVARRPASARASRRTFATASLRTSATEHPAALKLNEADKALAHHAAQASDLWRKISYYACIPGIVVCIAWVYNAEVEHHAHIEHIKEENGGVLPETPAYDYMNRRAKPFPWGVNSLFFNPDVNKDLSAA